MKLTKDGMNSSSQNADNSIDIHMYEITKYNIVDIMPRVRVQVYLCSKLINGDQTTPTIRFGSKIQLFAFKEHSMSGMQNKIIPGPCIWSGLFSPVMETSIAL